MKRLSRLTALLLVLLLFATAAAESAIPLDEFTSADYARLFSDAQSANDAVGKKALTNKTNVKVRNDHYLTANTIDTIATKGTEVTITSVENGILDGFLTQWYGVSYEKDGKTVTGYIETKYLDVQEPAPEISYTPWDGAAESTELSFTVSGAAGYQWERGLIDENGNITWEKISSATAGTLQIDTTVDNLKYAYRCTATDSEGNVLSTSEKITLVFTELAQWMSTNEPAVTAEMLARALKATKYGLESMVLENNQLIYMRTGEVFATMDENNILTDKALNLQFARVDWDSKTILPIATAQPADDAVEQ